jgi:putative transcriptional regulator
MSMTYHSKAREIIHGSMARLFLAGLLDKQSMLQFDQLCLSGPAIDPDTPQIEPALQSAVALRELRAREGVSIVTFAKYLKVAPQMVISWEAGTAQPSAIVAHRLAVITKDGLPAVH